MKAKALRLLLLEDNPVDAELIELTLRRAGIEFSSLRVDNRDAFVAALDNFKPTLILSDYQLPQFNGLQALEIVRHQAQHLPFIFVTGAMGEVQAVESLHRGATDYILKDRLQRLPEAVRRSIDEAAQRTATLLAATVFSASEQGIVITDAQHMIEMVNSAFTVTTGYSSAEVVGENTRMFKSGFHDAAFYQAMWATLAATDHWQGEVTNRRKDGSLYPEWLSIAAVRDATGAISNYVGIFTDLTTSKALDERLAKLSHFDTLTELPNRTLFMDRFDQAIKTAQRFERSLALFSLDLARFRVLNDTYGFQVGDAALVAVAQRLTDFARDSDTIARLSGDEFVLCLGSLHQSSDAITLAKKLIEHLAVPIIAAGQEVAVSICMGISIYPDDGHEPDALLRAADIALQRSKSVGGDSFRFFSPEEDTNAARRMRLEADLRTALAHDEFEVNYQPQIDLISGRINGIEALLRWNHPHLGRVSPTEFIPLAEEAGLIASIGAWTLLQACRQNKIWHESELASVPVAVNLSAKQFRRDDLIDTIRDILEQTGLPPRLLELELTESAFVGDIDAAARVVKQIKSLGVLLALDDFGTGYSSLSYISRFAFDKIKIDQSFVADIVHNPVNAAIATATIGMGRSLKLAVLAEGVETDAQMQFLRARQCESMQGFLFSEALCATDLTAMLNAGLGLEVGAGSTALQTLLLVDDETSILSSLKRLLRSDGYEILTATSPKQAMELLAQHSVQVIVSDQRMPEMSGTEFLSRVKQMYPDTIRIILSGYTDLDTVTEAINRGAIYRFLTKPWDADSLRAEIHEAFRVASGLVSA